MKKIYRTVADIICREVISKTPFEGLLSEKLTIPVARIRFSRLILSDESVQEIIDWLITDFQMRAKITPNGDWRIEARYSDILRMFEKTHEGQTLKQPDIRRRRYLEEFVKRVKESDRRTKLEAEAEQMFDGSNLLRWRCGGCGKFIMELKDWEEIKKLSRNKIPRTCINNHKNYLHIWGGSIEFSSSPVSIRELIGLFKKGKA